MPYKYVIFQYHNEIETSEETYETYKDAEYDAQQWISDYGAGAEVLELANEDYGDPEDVDYVIIEV